MLLYMKPNKLCKEKILLSLSKIVKTVVTNNQAVISLASGLKFVSASDRVTMLFSIKYTLVKNIVYV